MRLPSHHNIAAAMGIIDPVFLNSPLLRGTSLDRAVDAGPVGHPG